MYIKFLEDVTVQDRSQRHFPKGCVVEMAADACRHFVIRKKAMFCDGPNAPVEKESLSESDRVDEIVEDQADTQKKRKNRRK